MIARRVALGFAGLVLLLLIALTSAWWWSGTQASLDWALRRFGPPAGLSIENATGSLRRGVHASRIVWQQEGLQAEARGVDFAWQPLDLLQKRLHLTRLRAEQVLVADTRPPSTDKPQPPQQLTLPVQVAVDDILIGRLRYQGRTLVEASELAGQYGYDGQRHRLALRSAVYAQGRYSGEIGLGARAPMPLSARVQGALTAPVPGGAAAVRLRLDATAQGTLQDFEARARLNASPTAGPADSQPAATATAHITPWAEQPVPQARASLRRLDLGALWPQAPVTQLEGELSLAPAGTGAWALGVDLRNAQPGPWDERRLPLSLLKAEAEWRGGTAALVKRFNAELAGGRAEGQGQWEGERDWRLQVRVQGVDPAGLHGRLGSLPISGQLQANSVGTRIGFDLDLKAASARKAVRHETAAALRALELQALAARGAWDEGLLMLSHIDVRSRDAALAGQLQARPAQRSGQARLDLRAPGLSARVDGRLAEREGQGQLQLEVTQLAQAMDWLRRLPGVPQDALPALAGQGGLDARWQGGWRDPSVQARLQLPSLQPVAADNAAPAWRVKDGRVTLNGRLADARLGVQAQASLGTRELRTALEARLGRIGDNFAAWQGQLASLRLSLRDTAATAPISGEWTLQLQQPVALRRQADGRIEAGAGLAVLTAPVRRGPSQALLAWEPVRWGGGELQTAGRLSDLPLSWIELVGGRELLGSPLTGDMVFEARWQARLGQDLHLRASIARTQGDLTLTTETSEGTSTRITAGIREARISVQGDGPDLRVALRWASEHAGTADGQLTTRLVQGSDKGWQWPADAPVAGRVQAQLPRLGVWSLLAPPGWRLRGSLAADVAVAGTRSDPQLSGGLKADDLALRSVVDGVALDDGRLRARLEGQRLVIDELLLQGPAVEGGERGQLRASGAVERGEGGVRLRVDARVQRLRASVRSDRQLTFSGDAQAVVDGARTAITGALRVDQARIVLPEDTAPKLGEDVVVRNLPPGVSLPARPPAAASGGRPVHVDVAIDLGNDFRISGRGVNTALRGQVNVRAESLSEPRLEGTVRTQGGQYMAYGQKMEIARGVLRFTGPLDNPALDVLALRPNMASQQKVGVQITGRAQAPVVQLYADPDMTEAEKLSWLVLGRSSAEGGAEAALLQRAALAFMARRGGGQDGGIAKRFGLDDLSVSRGGEEGPSITLGKRFADNFYASYQRSLSGALGTLFVFYDLGRRVTLRAQAGERSGVDLIYTFRFD